MTELGIVTNRLGFVGIIALAACTGAPPPLECFDDEDCPPSNVCQQLTCVPGVQHQTGDAAQACPDADCGVDGSEPTPDAGARDAGFTALEVGVPDGDAGETTPLGRHNIVFVTSTGYPPGALGGLEGADAICRRHAEQEELPRPETYVALLSDRKRSARSKLAGSRGWVRTDGLAFADRLSDLISGRIWHPAALDERGMAPDVPMVPTGSSSELRLRGDASTCESWTSTTAGNVSPVGDSRDGAGFWLNDQTGPRGCDEPLALFCFGTGQTAPVAPPELPPDARIAFSTTERIGSGGGLASLDALCQRQADEAGLTGRTFVALTAPGPGLNVLSRFELEDGPWYRPDGVKVADGLLNLSNESLLAPVNTDAEGIYAFNRSILAGAFGTASAALHCGSWTSTLGQTRIGQSGSSTRFFRGNFTPCTSEFNLLCFEVASSTGT